MAAQPSVTPRSQCAFQTDELGINILDVGPIIYHDRSVCLPSLRPELRYFFYYATVEHKCGRLPNGCQRPMIGNSSRYSNYRMLKREPKAPSSVWTLPDYKGFFATPYMKEVQASLKERSKPLLLVNNKFDVFTTAELLNARDEAVFSMRSEYNEGFDTQPTTFKPNEVTMKSIKPTTAFLPLPSLKRIFEAAAGRYTIVYNRFGRADGYDKNEILGSRRLHFADKDMIRREHPEVILYDDLVANKSTAVFNLGLLSLASIAERIVTVPGGTSFLFSQFGGMHLMHGTAWTPNASSMVNNMYLFLGARNNITLFRSFDPLSLRKVLDAPFL